MHSRDQQQKLDYIFKGCGKNDYEFIRQLVYKKLHAINTKHNLTYWKKLRNRKYENDKDKKYRISQLPKLCVKISILMHRHKWVHSFSTRLTSVTFAEEKVLIFLILRKNAKIVQL